METRLEKLSTTDILERQETTENKTDNKHETMQETPQTPEERQEKDDNVITITALDSEEQITVNFQTEQEKKKQERFF
jgi:hypothetical protein